MDMRVVRRAAVVCLGLCAAVRGAGPVSYTVHADKVVKQIDVRLYGQFLEHIFNSVHGGLWGDQILNGTLELDPPRKNEKGTGIPRGWAFAGDKAGIRADKENSLNAEWSVHMQRGEAGDGPALTQGHIALKAGERYTLSLYGRGTASVTVAFTVDKDALITTQVEGVTKEWQKFTVEFVAPRDVEDATLAISPGAVGEVNVDEVSLFSAAALANHNLRPDLYQAVADLKPATIRWPGGSFANNYVWENGIGASEKRLPHPVVQWGDRDPNQFGTDEFLQMCERLHAEPILVINTGRGVEEGLKWLHYCMDDAGTEMGKVRAANGHAEPYHLHTIEIDNEAWLMMGYPKYLEIVKAFCPAIRKEFPSLELSVCGSYAYDTGPGEGVKGNENWDERIIKDAGTLFDVLSPHYYNGLLKENPADFVDDPRKYEGFLRSRGEMIAKSGNPNIKIYVSEWNLTYGKWGNDWRTGLYAGGILNAFEREADVVRLSCPALFMRKIGVTKSWDNALINFDQRSWFPAGNYVVMKLWRDHYEPGLLAVEGQEGGLNVVGTESEDKGTVVLKVVNPGKEAVEADFALDGFAAGKASMEMVAPGAEDARNSIGEPHRIHVEAGKVTLNRNSVHAVFPGFSAAVVQITR